MNRKNWLSALLAVVMVLSMLTAVAMPAVAATGLPEDADSVQNVSGSTSKNFTVSSFEDLFYVVANYSKFDSTHTIYFTTDLDINDYDGNFAADFAGIGVSHDKWLKASIDGLGHTIYNYTDTHAFILGTGGDICNLNFVGGEVSLSGYGGFLTGYCAVGAGSTITISNVHIIGAKMSNVGNVSSAFILGALNNKARIITVENCSVVKCELSNPDCADAGPGLLSARLRDQEGSQFTFRNCLVAESTLICNNSSTEGGGLVVGDAAMRSSAENTFVKFDNIAAINNKQINTATSLSGIVIAGSKFASNISMENIYASGNQRSVDGGATWAPMTALADRNNGNFTLPTNYVVDSGVTHLLDGGAAAEKTPVDGMTFHDMLLLLNENADCDDWGYTSDMQATIVDPMQDQMVPHIVTIQFGDHTVPGDAGVYETMYTDVNGKLIATEEQMANVNSIPQGAIPGYEAVTNWANVVFTADADIGAIVHNLVYTWDEVNHTHSVFCIEGCSENAENVPCTPILTDYNPATYFEHECADYACDICKNAWVETYTDGAKVSPFSVAFDAKTYKAGETVKVRVGVNEDTKLNAFTAEISFDPAVLTYVDAVAGTNTADSTIVYTCDVNTVNAASGELTVVAMIPDAVGTVYLDTWVTLTFTAKDTVAEPERADITMDVVDYARIGDTADFLEDEVLVTGLTANSYLLPVGGVSINFTPGDINENGVINVFDVLLLEKALRGDGTLSANQMKAANVDGDNYITVADASLLLRYVVDSSVYLAPSYVTPNM